MVLLLPRRIDVSLRCVTPLGMMGPLRHPLVSLAVASDHSPHPDKDLIDITAFAAIRYYAIHPHEVLIIKP